MARDETLVGVISDTHGLVRPEALAALRGSDLIVHAGDVGKPAVLEVLRELAPVWAVRGNVDSLGWAGDLPTTQAVEIDGLWLYVLHNLAELDLDPVARGFGVVVSGHSHRPLVERREGVLYLNPGSAGPRRFELPIALARLRVRGGQAEAELIELDL